MSQAVSAYGLMRRQENGARHRGMVRSEASRQRMSEAARGRTRPSFDPTPLKLVEAAVMLVFRGETHRAAARKAGVSLGALQRALRRMGA